MRSKLLFIIFLFLTQLAVAQKTRVQGKITDDNKRPIAGALIVDKGTQEILGAANDDGFYSILVSRGQVLIFESIGSKDTEVVVGNDNILNMELELTAVELDEVEVLHQVTTKIIPEPTDIEIKGEYFILKTRVRVPKEMAKSNTRMIFQPYIADVTEMTTEPMRPLVLDGREYNLTQDRMYNFNIEEDVLSPYIYEIPEGGSEELIPFKDSIYVEDQTHDFRAEVLITLEDYRKVLYTDSFVIAKGTVNPLRFYEYTLDNTGDLDSAKYLPKPVLQLRNDNGEVELVFETGKATIDNSVANNQVEMQRLNRRLNEITSDPNYSLKSFKIFGQSSPDGTYESNLNLAKKRMDFASKEIMSQLPDYVREAVDVESDASVATWEQVVELLEQDSLNDLASAVTERINTYPKDMDSQGVAIKRMKGYRPLIVEEYLPQLRRVSYEFGYSVFRTLTFPEIKHMYETNPEELTRYEYYRLYEAETDPALRTKYLQEAYAAYPKFLYAAYNLAKDGLDNGKGDPSILEPFMKEDDLPVEVLVVQAMTYLSNNRYQEAKMIVDKIPANESDAEDLRAVIDVYNGDYELGYQMEQGTGSLNEVLLLLALKRNELAWEKAQQLKSGVAKHEYVRAVAANRLDLVGEAIMFLDMAFELDPELRKVASIDGDVNDLLEE